MKIERRGGRGKEEREAQIGRGRAEEELSDSNPHAT